MKKIRFNIITIMLFLSVVALIVIQTFQILQLYDRKESQFDEKVNDCLYRIAYSHEKADELKYLKEVNRDLGIENDYLNDDFSYKESTSIKDTNVYVKGKKKQYFVLQGEVLDTISGLSAQQKVLIRDVRNYQDLELKGDSSRLAINLDPKIRDQIESKIRYVGSLMIKAYRNNPEFTIHDNLDVSFLDSIIKSELKKEGLPLDYTFKLENQTTIKNKSSNYNSEINENEDSYRVNLFPNSIFKNNTQLVLQFPEKKQYLYSEMIYTFIATGILVIFIVIALFFMFKTIMQQKKLSELKSDFISNMTHEFKTPISTISLACQAINDKDIIGEKNNSLQILPFVEMIQKENKRLEILVESILQSSVVDNGKFEGKIEKIKLDEIISSQVENIGFRIQNRNGQITFKKSSDSEYIINTDKIHITNLIANLLDNAVKYTSENPVIDVELSSIKQTIVLRIKDNGIGIKKEHLSKIFDKLFRVPTGNIHNVKGFGLGLSYVKSICDNYNWHISVDSNYGEGTTFEILFKN